MKLKPFWKSFPGYLLLVLITGLATQPAIQAAGPTGSVPYQTTGKVDGISANQKQIVIGDRVYIFADNVTILSANRVASKGNLKKGQNVGFNSTADRHRPVIKEIWILPTK